jgi:lysozyme
MDPTNAIAIAVPFTANFEGFSSVPYLDAGSYAIGYGNHYYEDGSAVSADDDPIDQDRATQLLTFFISQVATELAPHVSGSLATDNMLAALTDLGYNWGAGSVLQSKLLQLINAGSDPTTITAQWQQTAATSGGVYNSDLYNRRIAEAGLAFSGSSNLLVLLVAGLVLLGVILFSSRKKA